MEITGELLLHACNKARPYITHLLDRRRDDVEDILQSACVKALVHAADFQGASQFSTWFCTIARNEALMLFRKKQPSGDDSILALLPSPKPNPEQIALHKAHTADLAECVMLLPGLQRNEALLWANEDIRKPTFGNTSTRKARRHKAIRGLRVMLEIQ
jgi:RNA polymerase sigma factor (sigma-70 family)